MSGDAPRETASCYYLHLDPVAPELAALPCRGQLDTRPGSWTCLWGDPGGDPLQLRPAGRRTASQLPVADASLRSCYGIGCGRQTGTRSFEEFWEKYYECRGLSLSTEEFVRQMNAWCPAGPGEHPLGGAAGRWLCLAREAHMALGSGRPGSPAERLLVSGRRLPPLGASPPEGGAGRTPRDPNRQPDRLSRALLWARGGRPSGYASGMPAPPSTGNSGSSCTDGGRRPGAGLGQRGPGYHRALRTPPPGRRGDHIRL